MIVRSLLTVAVLGSLAAACATVTPRLLDQRAAIVSVDQSAAIVSAVIRVVPDQAPAIAAAGIRGRPSQAAAITAAAIQTAPDQADAILRAAIATEPGQAKAIVRAATLAVERGDNVSALPRQVFTGGFDAGTSNATRDFVRGDSMFGTTRIQ